MKAQSLTLLFSLCAIFFGGSAHGACLGPTGGTVGTCAADFSLKDLQGKEVRLSQFQGQVVLLNFWATWCKPCAIEFPSMQQAAKQLESSKVVILAVSIDSEGKSAVAPYLARVLGGTPRFPVLLDSGQKVSKQYGTFKVPETYVIDKTGRIIDKVEGIREWNESITVHYLQLLDRI